MLRSVGAALADILFGDYNPGGRTLVSDWFPSTETTEKVLYMKEQITKVTGLFPGLVLVTVIGVVASYCSSFIVIGSVAIAIIFGIAIGNLFSIHRSFQTGVVFAEKRLLSLAIMLLGVQLNVSVLEDLGWKTVGFIVLIVSSSIVVGYCTGRICKLSPAFSFLLGIGNAVCGSSAIAGVAPLVNAKEEETGLSISIVNFLGTLGIFLVPFLANLVLEATTVKNGIVIGGTLQAVGQVTAAGFGISDEVGKIATVIKMGRILMLGPVLLCLSLAFRTKAQRSIQKPKLPVPGFIVGFVLLTILTNLHILPVLWIPVIKKFGKGLLILAMAGVGLKITFSSIIRQGPKALFVGLITFLFQIGLGLGFVSIFY